MESTAEQVQFPLLKHWVDYTYRPCTIPYRFPSDPPHQATRTEVLWLELFRNSIPSFRSGFMLFFFFFLLRCSQFLHGCCLISSELTLA
jgi:hypothetical protein